MLLLVSYGGWGLGAGVGGGGDLFSRHCPVQPSMVELDKPASKPYGCPDHEKLFKG